jgi:hypothetical protein
MRVRVLHADVHGVRTVGLDAPRLRDDHGPLAEDELRAVLSDPKAHAEPKRFAEPIRRGHYVRIREHRDHVRRGNGTIRDHSPMILRSPDTVFACGVASRSR